MIVNKTDGYWRIVFHRAHGLLAMKFAVGLSHEYWPLPEYFHDGLLAIAAHDDGRQAWNEKSYITEHGAPLDYRQNREVDVKQAHRVVSDGLYTSSFMALMVALHIYHLYKECKQPEVVKLLREQHKLRQRLYETLQLGEADIAKCYDFLKFCDQLSLLICQQDIPDGGEMIACERLGNGLIKVGRVENELMFDPWPFRNDRFELFHEYYLIPQKPFGSNEQLKSAIESTIPRQHTLYMTKQA